MLQVVLDFFDHKNSRSMKKPKSWTRMDNAKYIHREHWNTPPTFRSALRQKSEDHSICPNNRSFVSNLTLVHMKYMET